MPPGTRNALVPPSPNYLRDAGQFVGGVGKGLANQFVINPLQMVQQSYEDPYSLGQGIYEGARGLVADPVGVVGNSLRSMWNRAKSSPAGLGEVVGENIDPRNWLKPRKVLRHELDVYHGTPHTFDPETGAPLGRFRSEKIGTGEGAQVYGYGLYFAENPDVANEYRQIAGNLSPHVGGGFAMPDAAAAKLDKLASALNLKSEYNRGIFSVYDDLRAGEFTPDALKRRLKKELDAGEIEPEYYNGAMQGFQNAEKVFAETKGSRYKVDLPDAKIEQMMDWDKPLSQQSEYVRNSLKRVTDRLDREIKQNGGKPRDYTGWDIYQYLNETWADRLDRRGISYEEMPSSKAVALKLQRLGIPGVKFLDQGSRGVGQGTRNFVVFPGEEQHLNILSRD